MPSESRISSLFLKDDNDSTYRNAEFNVATMSRDERASSRRLHEVTARSAQCS